MILAFKASASINLIHFTDLPTETVHRTLNNNSGHKQPRRHSEDTRNSCNTYSALHVSELVQPLPALSAGQGHRLLHQYAVMHLYQTILCFQDIVLRHAIL
jgi:hypothetical protein